MQAQARQEVAQQDANLGQATYRSIEDLQSAGINVSDIKKLQEAGLHTIGSVLQTCSRDLVAIKGLSDAKVEKVIIEYS